MSVLDRIFGKKQPHRDMGMAGVALIRLIQKHFPDAILEDGAEVILRDVRFEGADAGDFSITVRKIA